MARQFKVVAHVMTGDGTVQPLPSLSDSNRVRRFSLTAGRFNASPIAIGDAALTGLDDMGEYLPAATAGAPPAPAVYGEFEDGQVFLHDHYVLIANGEKLHIFAHMYQ